MKAELEEKIKHIYDRAGEGYDRTPAQAAVDVRLLIVELRMLDQCFAQLAVEVEQWAADSLTDPTPGSYAMGLQRGLRHAAALIRAAIK